MRLVLLLLAFAAALPAVEQAPPPEFVQAVEFPYYLYPRTLWERELVWLKNMGIRTVEFSIPWNWHQVDGGTCDFTGATDRKRTRLNSSHLVISYAVFCLKKNKTETVCRLAHLV